MKGDEGDGDNALRSDAAAAAKWTPAFAGVTEN